MNLTTRELVLVTIKEAGGTIKGRTLLQKRLYFLEVLLEINLGYRAHYYGPYSPQVDAALGNLQGLWFVEERQKGFGTVNEDGFEVRRYDYELTDDGKIIVNDLKKHKAADYKKVVKALQCLKEAKEPDYITLSVAAKTHYILSREDSPMTTDEIVKVAGELNWKISPKQFRGAAAFLERLGLVTLS